MFYMDKNGSSRIEWLDDGVYLERLTPFHSYEIIEEDYPLVFGRQPDCWYFANGMDKMESALLRSVIALMTDEDLTEQAIEEETLKWGYDLEAGCSIEAMKKILKEHGLWVEETKDLSLKDMMEIIDGESVVLCRVNTWLLESDASPMMFWAAPNDLVVLHTIDIGDPSVITVQYSSTEIGGMQFCDWDRFQKAWASGGREALIVDRNEII